MIDSFNIADCFSLLDVWTVWSCICEKLLLYFEGQVTHMTKTNTIQVIDELAELAEHPSPPPLPIPDHAGFIPGYYELPKMVCHCPFK